MDDSENGRCRRLAAATIVAPLRLAIDTSDDAAFLHLLYFGGPLVASEASAVHAAVGHAQRRTGLAAAFPQVLSWVRNWKLSPHGGRLESAAGTRFCSDLVALVDGLHEALEEGSSPLERLVQTSARGAIKRAVGERAEALREARDNLCKLPCACGTSADLSHLGELLASASAMCDYPELPPTPRVSTEKRPCDSTEKRPQSVPSAPARTTAPEKVAPAKGFYPFGRPPPVAAGAGAAGPGCGGTRAGCDDGRDGTDMAEEGAEAPDARGVGTALPVQRQSRPSNQGNREQQVQRPALKHLSAGRQRQRRQQRQQEQQGAMLRFLNKAHTLDNSGAAV